MRFLDVAAACCCVLLPPAAVREWWLLVDLKTDKVFGPAMHSHIASPCC